MIDIEKSAAFLKALGHPTRLMIVKTLLAEQCKCVGEMESILKIRQANASQHLTILKNQHIVNCNQDGNLRCYSLQDPKLMQQLVDLISKQKG